MSALLTPAAGRAGLGSGRPGDPRAETVAEELREAVAEERPGSALARPTPGRSNAPAGGRLTLEQRLDSVWEGLRAGGAPECPLCRSSEFAPSADGAAGRCRGCGSALA